MSERSSGRYQNFDAIRLLAATAVMFSHSYALSATGYDAEPLVRLLDEKKNDFGLVGVGVFFIISGFLITRSYLRRASTASYVANRVLRIFPALLACVFVTGFLIGPWFADSVRAYFTSPGLRGFVFHTSTLQHGGGTGLPVPWYDGAYGWWVIGTFWTLPAEFTAYIGVLLLGTARLLRLPVALALVGFGLWTHSHWPWSTLGGTAWTLMFFAAGSALYFIHERWRPHRAIIGVALAGLLVSTALGHMFGGLAVFGSVAVIQLATSSTVRLPRVARYGDLSYGLYLWGWPMQQLVRAAWGPTITWWQLFLCAMPLGLMAAWLSWHLVEERALGLARRFRRREGGSTPALDPAEPVAAEPVPAGVGGAGEAVGGARA